MHAARPRVRHSSQRCVAHRTRPLPLDFAPVLSIVRGAYDPKPFYDSLLSRIRRADFLCVFRCFTAARFYVCVLRDLVEVATDVFFTGRLECTFS